MTDRHRRHVLGFYAFTALWYLQPTSALWILYLLHCGWTLWQVGIAEAAWHAVSLLSNLPTGAFADRYGRRLSLAIGVAVGVVQPLAAFAVAPVSVPWGTVVVALGALAYTFVGGADRALLYGIAASAPDGVASYGPLYGRVLQVSYLAESAGNAAGGLLAAHLGWAWPYGLTALTQLCALGCMTALPAGLPMPAPDATRRSSIRLLGDAADVLRQRPSLLQLVGFGAVLAVVLTVTNLYAQSTLVLKGASVVVATLLIAASNLCAAATGGVGGRLAQGRAARARLWLGGAALAVLVALVGAFPLGASAAAFLATKAADGLFDPVYETRVNAETPEAVRATVLSASGAAFSLGMIVVFPLAGLVMAAGHLTVAYACIAAVLALASVTLLRAAGRPGKAGRGRESSGDCSRAGGASS